VTAVIATPRAEAAAALAAAPGRAIAVELGRGPAAAHGVPTLYVAGPTAGAPLRALTGSETLLRSVSERHALVRGVELDGVTVERAFALDVPDDAHALVELDGGTVVAAGGAGPGSWVYVGIDPLGSDLVLRVAFPVLVANALAVLGGATDVAVAEVVPRAEVDLRADTPPDGVEPVDVAVEPAPAWPLPASPPLLLVVLAAALLLAELLAWRKGWA
jgi:hypothetical protein